MSAPAIGVSGLVKRYGGTESLRGIPFEIAPGEIFSLLGPAGAGKSTALNVSRGRGRRPAGEAPVFGHGVTRDHRTTRRPEGVVPLTLVSDRFFTVEGRSSSRGLS